MTWKTRKTDQQTPSIRRLLAVSFLALAVFLTACGSDGGTDAGGDAQAVDECVAATQEVVDGLDVEMDTQIGNTALQLCSALGLSQFLETTIVSCGDPDLFPALSLGGDLLLWSHPMSRMHPVDQLDAFGSGAPHNVDGVAIRDVIVVDVGIHGEFIQELVVQALPSASVTFEDMEPAFGSTQEGAATFVRASTLATVVRDLAESAGTDDQAIINVSFGGYNCGQVPADLDAAIMDAITAGFSFVVSAGNDETDQPIYPASTAANHDAIISVGSMNGANRSCFSNFGVNAETYAPGEEVYVEGRGTWSGSSFAAPQVAVWLATMSPDEFRVVSAVTAGSPADASVNDPPGTPEATSIPVVSADGTVLGDLDVETFCLPDHPEWVPEFLEAPAP